MIILNIFIGVCLFIALYWCFHELNRDIIYKC